MAEQQRQISKLQSQFVKATATIEALQAENEKLQLSTKRQVASFSKNTRVSKPKHPGGKPSSGIFSFQQAPRPEEISEPPLEAPVS